MPHQSTPDYTRLLEAIARRGNPEYVPMLELSIDPEIVSAVLGEPFISLDDQDEYPELSIQSADQRIRFWHQMGYDAICEGPSLLFPGTLDLTAEDTAHAGREERRWVNESLGVIASWDDFERYPWPDPGDFSYHSIEYASSHLPEGMGIVARGAGVMETGMYLLGFESMALSIYTQPDLVKAVFERASEILLKVLQTLVQYDHVIALFVGDDMGYKSGTFISPEHLRNYVIPFHKQAAKTAHNADIPYLLHSCGNLENIMNDLIDAGIDARHSFEDTIEPVESFAPRYTDRIAIIGGLDVDLISRKTADEVKARTRHILETLAPSRAYIFGSGNSIVNYMPVENYLAMVEEYHRFNGTEYSPDKLSP